MQIDRLNHLHFPPDSNPAPAGKESAAGGLAHGKPAAAAARANGPALVDRITHQPPGVVLKIQTKAAEGGADAATDAPVYADMRKTTPDASEAAHEVQMAHAHQQALARNEGVMTRMSLDKDGVLVVAKPHTAADETARAPSTDFVSMAVSTMREFVDEAARVKAESSAATVAEPSGKLKGLQHLAARFKLFA